MTFQMAKRVVIVGGGFAGITAAANLKSAHQVTMIDRSDTFEFLPNIHELVSDLKTPGVLRLSRERVMKRLDQKFVQDEVVRIDTQDRRVVGKNSETPYDALILAIGHEPTTFGVPGVKENAIGFSSVDDALRVRERVLDLLELDRPFWITVVGAGFTGVEVLGELLREFSKEENLNLRLVEGAKRPVPRLPKEVGKRVVKLAERDDVEVLTRTKIERVEPEVLVLEGGRILPSALTIWTTGNRPPGWLADSGLAAKGRGVPVQDTLQSTEHPGIFVAGDVVELEGFTDRRAAQALRMGEQAGKNVNRWLDGKKPKRFKDDDIPLLMTFGDRTTFLVVDEYEVVLEGKPLAAGRELTFQRTMAELERLSKQTSGKKLAKRMRVSINRTAFLPTSPFELVDWATGLRFYDVS